MAERIAEVGKSSFNSLMNASFSSQVGGGMYGRFDGRSPSGVQLRSPLCFGCAKLMSITRAGGC